MFQACDVNHDKRISKTEVSSRATGRTHHSDLGLAGSGGRTQAPRAWSGLLRPHPPPSAIQVRNLIDKLAFDVDVDYLDGITDAYDVVSISNSPRTWCLTRGRCVCARAWSAEGVRLTRITRGAYRTGRQRVPGPSRVQEAVFHCEEQAICSRQVRALPGQTHTRSWVAPGAADAMNPRRRQKRQETMANKKFQIMIGLAYAPSPNCATARSHRVAITPRARCR